MNKGKSQPSSTCLVGGTEVQPNYRAGCNAVHSARGTHKHEVGCRSIWPKMWDSSELFGMLRGVVGVSRCQTEAPVGEMDRGAVVSLLAGCPSAFAPTAIAIMRLQLSEARMPTGPGPCRSERQCRHHLPAPQKLFCQIGLLHD